MIGVFNICMNKKIFLCNLSLIMWCVLQNMKMIYQAASYWKILSVALMDGGLMCKDVP